MPDPLGLLEQSALSLPGCAALWLTLRVLRAGSWLVAGCLLWLPCSPAMSVASGPGRSVSSSVALPARCREDLKSHEAKESVKTLLILEHSSSKRGIRQALKKSDFIELALWKLRSLAWGLAAQLQFPQVLRCAH